MATSKFTAATITPLPALSVSASQSEAECHEGEPLMVVQYHQHGHVVHHLGGVRDRGGSSWHPFPFLCLLVSIYTSIQKNVPSDYLQEAQEIWTKMGGTIPPFFQNDENDENDKNDENDESYKNDENDKSYGNDENDDSTFSSFSSRIDESFSFR